MNYFLPLPSRPHGFLSNICCWRELPDSMFLFEFNPLPRGDCTMKASCQASSRLYTYSQRAWTLDNVSKTRAGA
eukprot:6179982-Pleurochrysis_carterae.AAC.12